MTAEARSAAAESDPARSPVAVAHSPLQHWRSGHASRSSCALTRTGAAPVRDDPVVTDLVTRARKADKQAWDALVERYAPLIWSICRRHRLADADAEAVGQTVWLQLVQELGRIRDPAALPGWLATVTRRECLRVLRAARAPLPAGYVPDAELLPDEHAGTAEQELLLAEHRAALREAFLDLPSCGQRLIALLIADPPVPYTEISARLGIPVGSIGPARSRYLDRLRRSPTIAALINADNSAAADCDTAAVIDRRGAAADSALTDCTGRCGAHRPTGLGRCRRSGSLHRTCGGHRFRTEEHAKQSPRRLITDRHLHRGALRQQLSIQGCLAKTCPRGNTGQHAASLVVAGAAVPQTAVLPVTVCRICPAARTSPPSPQDHRRRRNGLVSPKAVATHANDDAPDRPVLHRPADRCRNFRNRPERRFPRLEQVNRDREA